MGFVVFWFILSIIVGNIANNKGRDGVGFFLLSLILSPLIGIIAALAAKPNNDVLEKRQLKSGQAKRCPNCAELVKKEANVCRYCGRELPIVEIAPQTSNGTLSSIAIALVLLGIIWGIVILFR